MIGRVPAPAFAPTPLHPWRIAGLLSVSICINLIDRQVLSVVAPVLREELRLSNTQYSYIVFAFQLGMLLGQVPAGVLMDLFGTRLGLTVIFLGWSLSNGLHSVARALGSFMGLRFLMGLTECGNYTGGIKAIARLFPPQQRALAGGVFNAGAQLGSVIAPPIIVLIVVRYGWRAAFLIPSLLGLVWVIPWLRSFPPDRLRQKASASSGSQIALSALLHSRPVLGLVLLRVFTGPLTSFYWYWLPEYLRHGRGMPFLLIGWLAWIPYLFGGLGNLAGGLSSDYLIRRGVSVDAARKVAFTAGMGLSALSVSLPFVTGNHLALALICAIVFGNNWAAATYIGMVGDLFHESVVGRVNGIAGAGDSGAGMLTMLATGVIVDRFSYSPVLIAAGIMPLLAIASLFLVVKRIEPTGSLIEN